MSAFIVSASDLASICSGLMNLRNYSPYASSLDEDAARSTVAGWAAANAEAICQRYGDKQKPEKLPDLLPAAPSVHQLLKSLDCLSYQCAEGTVGDKCFKKEMKSLHEYRHAVSDYIIAECPEYQNARWG